MAPLYVPLSALTPDQRKRWVERQMQKNIERGRQEIERREKAAEREHAARDTKPMMYVDDSSDHPIVIFGGGQHWYNDLKDLAARKREQEWTAPERLKQPDPMLTLRTVLDRQKREAVGMKVFHISNNPISSKE